MSRIRHRQFAALQVVVLVLIVSPLASANVLIKRLSPQANIAAGPIAVRQLPRHRMLLVANLRRYIAGEKLLNVVDSEKGY